MADKSFCKPCKLYAPKEFWESEWREYVNDCNGCGSDSTTGVTNWLGWDTSSILGCSIWFSCAIHDFMYAMAHQFDHVEASNDHKVHCDRVFLNNMARQVEHYGKANNSWSITTWARKKVINWYYQAVLKFGGTSYWEKSNSLDEYREVTGAAVERGNV